jgi:hypothetical protein
MKSLGTLLGTTDIMFELFVKLKIWELIICELGIRVIVKSTC